MYSYIYIYIYAYIQYIYIYIVVKLTPIPKFLAPGRSWFPCVRFQCFLSPGEILKSIIMIIITIMYIYIYIHTYTCI